MCSKNMRTFCIICFTTSKPSCLNHLKSLNHFFYRHLDWDTGIFHNNHSMTVRDLLQDVYEKSCTEKKWALVRHSAGMLGKQVEDLAKSVADLLVRQKQITVGMPPHHEHVSDGLIDWKMSLSLFIFLSPPTRLLFVRCLPKSFG